MQQSLLTIDKPSTNTNQIKQTQDAQLDLGIDILINGQQQKAGSSCIDANRYAVDCSREIDISDLIQQQKANDSDNISSSQQLNFNDYIAQNQNYKQSNILQQIEQESYLQNGQLQDFQNNCLKKTNSNEQILASIKEKYPLINYRKTQKKFKPVKSVMFSQLNKQLQNLGISLSQIKKIYPIKRSKQAPILYLIQSRTTLLIYQQEKINKISYDDQIEGISIKSDQKFVIIYFSKHILIYQILSDVMRPKKHIASIPVEQITSAIFINSANLQFILCDNQYKLLYVRVDQSFVFSDKIISEEIQHNNDVIGNIDYISYQGHDLLVVTSSTHLQILRKNGKKFQSKQFINIDINSKKLIQALWLINKDKKLSLVAAVRGNIYVLEQGNSLNQAQFQFKLTKLFHSHNQLLGLSLVCDSHILIDYIDKICMITLKQVPQISGFQYQSRMASQICLDCTFNSKTKFIWEIQKANINCKIVSYIPRGVNNNDDYMRQFLIIDRDINKDMLVICQLLKLEQKVKQLIEEKAFHQAFKVLICVFKGLSFSLYYDYQNKLALNQLLQQSFKYCLSSIDSKTDADEIMNRIMWMCQLTTECEKQSLIWDMMIPRLNDLHLTDMFFQLSHIFILDDQFKFIPQQILYLLIQYHATLLHQIVLEKLLLKDQNYDPLRIISIIQSKKMYYLQFFIFSKDIFNDGSQYDFYTPFIRVFSVLKTTNDWEAGMATLWFLQKCFMFQTVEKYHYIMNPLQKKAVVTNFIVQITNPSIIDVLIDFSPRLALQILSIPFVKQDFIDLMDERMDENTKLYQALTHNMNGKQFIDIYFQHILDKCQKLDMLQYTVQFFCLGFYSKCNKALKWECVYPYVKQLLSNQQICWTIKFPKKHIIPKLEYILIKMINYLSQTQSQEDSQQQRAQLLNIKQTRFLFCLYRLNKHYKASLQVLLKFPNKYYGLFDFMTELFHDIARQDFSQQETSLHSIQLFLTGNLKQLLFINRQKTITNCNKVGLANQDISDIILESYDQQAMVLFILGLLEKYGQKPFLKKQMFLIEYTKIISSYPMKKMITFLTMIKPDEKQVEQILKIMAKLNNRVGCAIIYANIRKVGKALAIYEQLIKQSFEKDIDPDNYQFVQEMSFYLKKYLKLGLKTTNPQVWIDILILSSNVMERLQLLTNSKVFLIAKKIRCRLIHSIFNQLPTSFVLQLFQMDKFYQQKELRTEFVSNLMRKICICIKFDMILYRQVERISQKDTKSQRITYLKKNLCGYQSKGFCQFCNQNLNTQEASCIYSCGHAYHLICHSDPSICLQCSYISKSKEIQRSLFTDDRLTIQNQLYIHLSKMQTNLFENPQQKAKQQKLASFQQYGMELNQLDTQLIMAFENPKQYYPSFK